MLIISARASEKKIVKFYFNSVWFSDTFYSIKLLMKLANISTSVLFVIERLLLEMLGYFKPV